MGKQREEIGEPGPTPLFLPVPPAGSRPALAHSQGTMKCRVAGSRTDSGAPSASALASGASSSCAPPEGTERKGRTERVELRAVYGIG